MYIHWLPMSLFQKFSLNMSKKVLIVCANNQCHTVYLLQDHVMRSKVLSDLLFKDDELVNELAESLETTSVQGVYACVLVCVPSVFVCGV